MKRFFAAASLFLAISFVTSSNARAQDLFSSLGDLAGGVVDDTLRSAGQGAEEVVFVAGDASELVYEFHPGARIGRSVGLLPQGQLRALPSHRAGYR